MATIYEVARYAGVSTATISKVLSGKGYVSEPTRERVFKAISELSYVPSQRARALTKGRSFIVGLLVPYSSDQFFDDPHLIACMRGIEQVANQHDYNLLLSTARSPSDCAKLLRSSVIDGAIVIETNDNPLFVAALGAQRYPWVALGYPIASCGAIVHADDYGGARRMTEHLLELGHRRIAAIDSSPRPRAIDERLNALRDTLNAYGQELDPRLLATGDFSESSGYRAARQLLTLPDPPSAIFALNDRMAFGVLRCAQELGVRVPAQLSVSGFDDIPAASASTPPLTTVAQFGERLGQAAGRALFKLLDGNAPAEPLVIPTELVFRQTTGPA